MERRLEGMGLFLSRWMLALCLAVLGAGLLLGGIQAADNRRALVLAVLALPPAAKLLPALLARAETAAAWKVWLLLTLLCLGVKGGWVALVQVPPQGDYATFWGYARALAEQPVLEDGRYMALFPHIFGYASFLSWFIALFGPAPMLAPVLNVALTLCSGSLLFLLGRRVRGTAGGAAAYLLWILCPSQTMYNSLVLSEPLYTTLLLLFWLAVTGPVPARCAPAILSGAGAGVILRWFNGVRPIGAVPLIALLLWRFCLAPDGLRERDGRRRRLVLLSALLAAYLASGPLWQGQVAARLGEEPAVTPGYSVLVGFNTRSMGRWNQADSDLLFSCSGQPGATARQAQEAALDAAAARIAGLRPGGFARLFMEKLRGFLGSDNSCVVYSQAVVRHTGRFSLACNGFYYLLLLLVLWGGVELWRRGERTPVLQAPLYVLGLTLAQMLVEVAGRYHYSLIPALILAALPALFRVNGKWGEKNEKIP